MKAKVVQLNKAIPSVRGGIVSHNIHQDRAANVILFHFAAGEQLSEHTASVAATMHFLEGKARVTLGARRVTATTGTWVHMPANLRHAIRATERTVMLSSPSSPKARNPPAASRALAPTETQTLGSRFHGSRFNG